MSTDERLPTHEVLELRAENARLQAEVARLQDEVQRALQLAITYVAQHATNQMTEPLRMLMADISIERV